MSKNRATFGTPRSTIACHRERASWKNGGAERGGTACRLWPAPRHSPRLGVREIAKLRTKTMALQKLKFFNFRSIRRLRLLQNPLAGAEVGFAFSGASNG